MEGGETDGRTPPRRGMATIYPSAECRASGGGVAGMAEKNS